MCFSVFIQCCDVTVIGHRLVKSCDKEVDFVKFADAVVVIEMHDAVRKYAEKAKIVLRHFRSLHGLYPLTFCDHILFIINLTKAIFSVYSLL